MRRIYRYTIKKENLFEMLHARRHHPCLEITYRDWSGKYTHKLSAGYGDDLDVYREGNETYILSQNPKLGYVGLEIYEGPDKTGEMFVESERVTEILGRNDLAPFNIIKRLRGYSKFRFFCFKDGKYWHICEWYSGREVTGSFATTLTAAKQSARAYLNQNTEGDLSKMEAAIERHWRINESIIRKNVPM